MHGTCLTSLRTLPKILSLLLACTYFCFRVEPFEEEYEAHHRPPATRPAIVSSSLTWETFDKDNAPKAFTICLHTEFQFLQILGPAQELLTNDKTPHQPVRDKSPPSPL